MKKRMLGQVDKYYTGKVLEKGPTHGGVDWNSRESQELRFEQLLKLCDTARRFTINDHGCGWGGLYGYMTERGLDFDYHGFDISGEMIREAKKACGTRGNCSFAVGSSAGRKADYTVASGIFNVRLSAPDEDWLEHLLETLREMDGSSTRGFSFNCLTSYSDKERMKDYLYYADPCRIFDYCKRHFSRNVALLHDYGLYEFTVIVRK